MTTYANSLTIFFILIFNKLVCQNTQYVNLLISTYSKTFSSTIQVRVLTMFEIFDLLDFKFVDYFMQSYYVDNPVKNVNALGQAGKSNI